MCVGSIPSDLVQLAMGKTECLVVMRCDSVRKQVPQLAPIH